MESLRTRTLVVAALAVGALLVIVVLGREPATPSLEPDAARQTPIPTPSGEAPSAGVLPKPADREAGSQQHAAPASAITPSEWRQRLEKSSDYFQFVSDAAVAAQAGDGRAALLLSEALATCLLFKHQFGNHPDPKAAFDANLAEQPMESIAAREMERKIFSKCERFLAEDPFARLPQRAEGYTVQYWRRLAEQNNDPVARIQHALVQAKPSSAAESAAFLDTVRPDLATAIRSKDTDALFNAGLLLTDARISKDPLRGVAWMIVAVASGYDGPALKYPMCAETGSCPGAAEFSESLQRDIGAERYARVYAQSQEIKELMAREDWAALERYWMPDAPSR